MGVQLGMVWTYVASKGLCVHYGVFWLRQLFLFLVMSTFSFFILLWLVCLLLCFLLYFCVLLLFVYLLRLFGLSSAL
jgi:hypothetical protein